MPHALVGLVLDVRVTDTAVEVMHKSQRVALHPRYGKGRFVTLTEHMPKAHQAHQNWSPGHFLNWAKDIDPGTLEVVQGQLKDRPHPEHGYRACLGLLSLSRRYTRDRLEQVRIAHGDGSYARLMNQLLKTDLLILDDWGMQKVTAQQRQDLMEVIEDRHGRGSTLIASQLPTEHWHDHIGSATLADAILDRLLHGAHRLNLKGESLRKAKAQNAESIDPS